MSVEAALMQPWLLIPSTTATSSFCVACEHNHQGPRIPDYARGARLCGCFPRGWVAAADIPRIDGPASPGNPGPALLNLCTGKRVDLPRSLRDNPPDVTNNNLIHTIILSEAPNRTHIHPCYAAAIVSGKPNIAFWRPGMSYWTLPMLKWDAPMKKWKKLLPKDPIEDVVYCVGLLGEGFYVLTNKEDLLVYTPKTNDKPGEITMSSVETYKVRRNPRPTMPGPGEVLGRYLVQSSLPGEVLMVVRFVSTEKATVAFNVFKLEPQPPSWSWKKLTFDTIRDRTIFLVRGCSVAFDMRSPCPLYIYFLDDSARFDGAGTSEPQQIENPFPCSDAGRCRLFDQNIVHCLPPGPPSDCSWTWFFLPARDAMRQWSAMEAIRELAQQGLLHVQDE